MHMRLQRKKIAKRWLGILLAMVVAMGTLLEFVPARAVAQEGSDEPKYDEATDEMKYTGEPNVTVAAQGTHDFGVTIPADETYWVSYTVKATNGVYFDYRGSGRLYIDKTQYCVLGVNGKEDWVQKDVGLENGVKVTISVMPDKVTIWLNGEKAIENASLNTTGEGSPKVTWTVAETVYTDVKIWTLKKEDPPASDEPIYDEATDEMQYTGTDIAVASQSSHDFGVTIPADETYWLSFTAKDGSGLMYVPYRGNGGDGSYRMCLKPGQLLVAGEDPNTSLYDQSRTTGMGGAGARVTVESTPTTISVWLNGEKVLEQGKAESQKEGTPKVSWTDQGVTLTDVKIWTVKKEDPPTPSDEPTYNASTDEMKYTGTDIAVAAQSGYDFGVTIPADETYWLSFTAKDGSGLMYVPYRGTGGDGSYRMCLKTGQLLVAGKDPNTSLYDQSRTTGMGGAGAKVTVESTPTTISVWLNGEKVLEQGKAESQKEGTPRVSWTDAGVTLTDVKIWTVKKEDPPTPPISDEPVYNASTDNMKYTGESVTVAASSSHNFGVTIPEDETYWVSFTAKGTGTMYFPYRGNGGDGSSRLTLQSYWSQVTGSGSAGLYDKSAATGFDGAGTKITIESTPTTVSVWMNGIKIVDKAEVTGGEEGLPQVSWATDGAELTDVRIWAPKSDKPVPVEPEFNDNQDSMLNQNTPTEALTLDKGETFHFTTRESAAKTFYFSFTAKTNGDLWVNYRTPGRLYLGQNQYGMVGLEKEIWKPLSNLKDGVKVTIASTAESTSIWIDGVLVADQKQLAAPVGRTRTYARSTGTGQEGGGLLKMAAAIFRSVDAGFIMPSIAANDTVELSDIILWIEGEAGQNLDAPVYEPAEDTEFPMKGVSGGTITADGVVVGPESASAFITDLPYNADYCMSMRVTSVGDGAKSVNIRFRGSDSFLVMNQSGYQLVLGGEATEWVNWPLNMKYGVEVSIRSAKDRLQVWLDGYKIYDVPYTAGGTVQPGILWSYDNTVTLTGLKIWANEIPESDEPFYDSTADRKYDIEHVNGGSYSDGVIMVPAESGAILLSDLPYNASYYMTMTVKTEGAVNILYRDGAGEDQGLFTLKSDGYQSHATGNGEWVNKSFYSLASGARVTWYSSPERFILWVDGEKIIDDAYGKGGPAQPAIMWSFDHEVTVTDICIWTREDAYTDEPFYQTEKHILHEVTDYGDGSLMNGILTVDPLKNAYFATDLAANADYYMSFLVETDQTVNILYRNPEGMFQLSGNGYLSVGTDGEWVNKAIRKLPYGVRVTLHSTPEWITIWVNGEKLIDEGYTRAGESSPGIAWSFEKGVKVQNIRIWTEPEGEGTYLGDVKETAHRKLSQKKYHGAALRTPAEVQNYLDQQLAGRSVQNVSAENAGSSYQIFEADTALAAGQNSGAMNIWVLAAAIAAAVAAVVLIVLLIRARTGNKKI